MAQNISDSSNEVSKPVNVLYQQMLLRNARPYCNYFLGTVKGELTRNAGTATIAWRRYETSADNASGIAPTTTALAEQTTTASFMGGRDSSSVHFSAVTATVQKYGQFYILNEEVDTFLPNGTTAGITRTLAISAGRSLNRLQRNIAEGSLTLLYAGGVASTGVVVSKITSNALAYAINILARNFAETFSPMSDGSINIGTNPVLPGFWSMCHPDVAYDITFLPGFKSVETYASQIDTVPGEIGIFSTAGLGCRIVQSAEASANADTGGSVTGTGLRSTTGSVIDTYITPVYAANAIGSVGLGKTMPDGIWRAGDEQNPIEMIAHGLGSGGTSDPYNEISTLAWKAWWAGSVLNANWGRAIVSGATSISS